MKKLIGILIVGYILTGCSSNKTPEHAIEIMEKTANQMMLRGVYPDDNTIAASAADIIPKDFKDDLKWGPKLAQFQDSLNYHREKKSLFKVLGDSNTNFPSYTIKDMTDLEKEFSQDFNAASYKYMFCNINIIGTITPKSDDQYTQQMLQQAGLQNNDEVQFVGVVKTDNGNYRMSSVAIHTDLKQNDVGKVRPDIQNPFTFYDIKNKAILIKTNMNSPGWILESLYDEYFNEGVTKVTNEDLDQRKFSFKLYLGNLQTYSPETYQSLISGNIALIGGDPDKALMGSIVPCDIVNINGKIIQIVKSGMGTPAIILSGTKVLNVESALDLNNLEPIKMDTVISQ